MKSRQALVCSPDIPAHDRESGSRRVHHLIEFLREAGWSVTVVAQEAPNAERYVAQMQQRGVAAYVGFNARLEQLLDCQRFDLALFAFWHVAESLLPLVRRHSPSTRILIDSIDLHFLRNARGVFSRQEKPGVPPTLDQKFATEMMRELNVYAAADGVLTVSEKEADLINDLTNDPMLAFAVPDAEEMPRSPHPFAERKGILFIGNFRHAPNVGAAEYLCTQIVPLLDPALLAAHPIAIVGNELNEQVRSFARGLTGVNLVGWVPSVLPYLQRARITVIPLRYGAGTKRKLIQALMVGTPSVSTSIGAEGLGLADGEQVLVADDPARFASAVTRLLQDADVWQRLAESGRSHVTILHGRGTAATRLLEAVSEVLVREPKLPPVAAANSSEAYEQLIEEVCTWVQSAVPEGASVLVVSRGDDRLLELSGRCAGHFPQSKAGAYAGHHPGNSDEAIAHLEALRVQGAQFLVFPQTAFWWLEHYREFAAHLDAHYDRSSLDDVCILYRLSPRESAVGVNGTTNASKIERPATTTLPAPDLSAFLGSRETPARNVLVLGVYLTDHPNTASDIATNFSKSIVHRVTQRWVALGAGAPDGSMARVTVKTVRTKTPKFKILNDLLAEEDLTAYDYVLLTDDDIVIPDRFLDNYITLQERLDFRIAQPARTSNSYIDHPIVEQQRGVLARQTRFVEIGPVVSFHRSCFDLVFPFDLTSPMGWGYENVWSYLLAQRGMKMGIIDALPVDHSLRKPVANYSWAEADAQRKVLLKSNKHYTFDECFRVLAVASLEGARE